MPDNSSLLLLDRDQAGALLRPDDVLEAVRDSFLLHASGAGKIFPLVRESLSGPKHFTSRYVGACDSIC